MLIIFGLFLDTFCIAKQLGLKFPVFYEYYINTAAGNRFWLTIWNSLQHNNTSWYVWTLSFSSDILLCIALLLLFQLFHAHFSVFPSLLFISHSPPPWQNPSTSPSVSITWCRPDSPHNHDVEVVSSLRYNVLKCVCDISFLLRAHDLLWLEYLHAAWFAFAVVVRVCVCVSVMPHHMQCHSLSSFHTAERVATAAGVIYVSVVKIFFLCRKVCNNTRKKQALIWQI